jgi:hypothetical protein
LIKLFFLCKIFLTKIQAMSVYGKLKYDEFSDITEDLQMDNNIVIYTDNENNIKIDVLLEKDTVWLSQKKQQIYLIKI